MVSCNVKGELFPSLFLALQIVVLFAETNITFHLFGELD